MIFTYLNKKEKGSITLEATLISIPILILISTLLLILYCKLIALDARYALENTAEEMALLFPACEAALSELPLDKLKDRLPEILTSEEFTNLQSVLGDYTSSLFLGPFVEKRVDYWLDLKRQEGALPLKAHDRTVWFEWDEEGNCLILLMEVSVNTFLGDYQDEFLSIVPLWSDAYENIVDDEDTEDDEEKDSIWSKDNFTRGRYFREKENANLPFNFPVIAYFKNGKAKSIRSVDLTAPSYATREAAERAILKDLNRLASFNSFTSKSKNSKMPQIQEGDISTKEYVLIVPGNSPDYYDGSFISQLKSEANRLGINMVVKKYGNSKRYSNP